MGKLSLKDKLKEMSSLLEFMENREKKELDEIEGQEIVIKDYGFLESKDGEYACFTIASDEESFFFAPGILSQDLKELTNDGYKEDIQKEGLIVIIGEKKQSTTSKFKYRPVEYL